MWWWLLACLLVGGARSGAEADALPSVCNALRAVGANDEICQEIAADGAIELLASSLAAGGGADASSSARSRTAFGLLRQLAKSDGNKARGTQISKPA